jgi:triacylglycerol esterase/lipase EstA (alpha/beta hydrolase family)
MRDPRVVLCVRWSLLAALLVLLFPPAAARAQTRATLPALDEALSGIVPLAHSGILYDRVIPLAHIERFDGSPTAPIVDAATWRQAWDELSRATLGAAHAPELEQVLESARAARREGVLPLALFDIAYDRLRPEALTDGSVSVQGDRLVPLAGARPLIPARATAAAVLAARTFHGTDAVFELAPDRLLMDGTPRSLTIDLADGLGPRAVAPGERVHAQYAETGLHTLTASLTRADGSVAVSRFALEVAALAAPAPDDTLHVTATQPYEGRYGTGNAYVYRAPGHDSLVNPVVLVEGFDLDNSMGWDELYALLDQQGLIETLRAEGFDSVVLDFTDATEAIQVNAFVVESLIEQVQSAIDPTTSIAVVGASMGGLCSRYALAWMEHNAVPHRVRTWISFDSPQAGADIPLGLQYWISFFSGQSADAAAFLATLNRPAARQMLLYHFTSPAGTTGVPDPSRATLLSELAALGDYPALPRRVAILDGSGTGANQGFAPAAQVIQYDYSNLLVALKGNVWAVPDQSSATIFDGSIRILFSTTSQKVTVSGTRPWDGAPGGWRSSFAQLDATTAPYGDIVALHPSHCFIPSVSALGLSTSDPFFPIAGTPGVIALSPFDMAYWPSVNEEHVNVSPDCANWVRTELEYGVVSVPGEPARPARLALSCAPSPFVGATRLEFTLGRTSRVTLGVYGIDGRLVRSLSRGVRPAGRQALEWDGRDERGARVGAGVYFVRLATDEARATARVVRLD